MALPEIRHVYLDKLAEPYQLINSVTRDAGWFLADHHHPMFQMIWITQGTLSITQNGIDHYMRRGHLCMIPPGVSHALYTETGYTQLGFDLIQGRDQRGIIELAETYVNRFVILDRSNILSVVPELENLCRQFTLLAKMQAVHMLDSIVLSSIQTMESESGFRQQMVLLLHQHVEGKLTLSQISQRTNISASHLERMTKREFGCSVMELYHRLKISRACSLLLNSTMTANQIADALGFCDQAHFSRFFKQRMKVTPSQFRQSHN